MRNTKIGGKNPFLYYLKILFIINTLYSLRKHRVLEDILSSTLDGI